MARLVVPSAPSAARSSGSAAIARARLHTALHRERAAHRRPAALAEGPAAEPAQPDLLELLLGQSQAAPGGRP